MRCLFHRWGRWEDVSAKAVAEYRDGRFAPFVTMKITQVRRCARCNITETRRD